MSRTTVGVGDLDVRLPVAAPDLGGREREYLLDAFDSCWISSKGAYLERFEAAFAEYVGVQHALTVSNGTVALHLALAALEIGPGDEVIVPALTYVAVANAVTYVGARPVFVDVSPDDWNLSPGAVEEALTPRTRAVIAAHTYGQPADMEGLRGVCDAADVALVEDAAEALGAELNGRRAGAMGRIGTFSFYGNKTLTTGEGGMVCTNDGDLAARVGVLRNQGNHPTRRYWHDVVGFNYRMTNLQAAIGLAQLERVDAMVGRKREIAERYRDRIRHPSIRHSTDRPGARSAHWMSCILLTDPLAGRREEFRQRLGESGIETRPFFHPIPTLPPYMEAAAVGDWPIARDLGRRGMNLPSGVGLTDQDIDYVAACVERVARDMEAGS